MVGYEWKCLFKKGGRDHNNHVHADTVLTRPSPHPLFGRGLGPGTSNSPSPIAPVSFDGFSTSLPHISTATLPYLFSVALYALYTAVDRVNIRPV